MENKKIINKEFVLVLMAILAVTVASFSPSLKNDFTNWDDDTHLTKNLTVQSLSPANLKTIFTSTVNLTYIPLTILSFAIEYHFFKYQPFIYHFNNLLLHVAVVALIFYFALQTGLPLRAAALAALVFGIHPMHVESVAWVTERKDVLYSFFYTLTLIYYWRYLQTRRIVFYLSTIVLGLLSILAKPMAVSLPLILLLCDWLYGRKFGKKMFLEKWPYFLYIIPITWLSHSLVLLNAKVPGHTLLNSILVFAWTLAFYLKNFLFPFVLIPVYQLPKPISIFNAEYLAALGLVFLIAYGLFRFKQNRWFYFACFFYFFSIFPALRFDDVKEVWNFSVVADRFMYLPSLGVCFFLGIISDKFLAKFSRHNSWKIISYVSLAVVLMILSCKTFAQTKIWKDSLTLWTYVIAQSPQAEVAYNNRGLIYKAQGRHDLALRDYTQAIALNANYPEAYHNRANVHALEGRYDLAIDDYDKALSCTSYFVDSYRNRGMVYKEMKKYDLAIEDFNKALQINPQDALAYDQRSLAYEAKKNMSRALNNDSKNK